MRNLRTVAVASATAITVALGGITAASAQDTAPATTTGDKTSSEVSSDGFAGLSSGNGSSHFFNDEQDLFYITDMSGKETHSDQIPQWARYFVGGTIAAGVGTLVGLAIAGFNWVQANGGLQMPALPALPPLPQFPTF